MFYVSYNNNLHDQIKLSKENTKNLMLIIHFFHRIRRDGNFKMW